MSFMIFSVRRRAARSSKNTTSTRRMWERPINMNSSEPKKMKIWPIAGVTIVTAGETTIMMSKPRPPLVSDGNRALRMSCNAASGRSSRRSFSWIVRPISGALPSQSTTGAASSTMTP